MSIQNAVLTIETPIYPLQNIFLFNQSIDFVIDLSLGSNVKVDLFIGEEKILNSLPISSFIPGMWYAPLKLTRTYKFPGDYKVTAILSNSISSITLTKQITVMSKLSGLIVELKYSPIIYLPHSNDDYGRAYFQFKYEGQTCAPSHANVTFTVGDSNRIYGPFWLGMDFIQNISKTPFFHDYLSIGNYTAEFKVQNDISSITLSLLVPVVKSIYGVHLQVFPSFFHTGTVTFEQAFVEQGDEPIILEWFVDKNLIGKYNRTGKIILIKKQK
jgi:hypothetical protein